MSKILPKLSKEMFIFWVTLFKINLFNQKSFLVHPLLWTSNLNFWLTQHKLFSLEPTTFGSMQSESCPIGNTIKKSLDI